MTPLPDADPPASESRKARRPCPVCSATEVEVLHTQHLEIPAASPTPTVFGVEALSLRDARHLTDFKGFLDRCNQGKLVGWAVAENTAVSVTASVNGEPIKAVLSSLERPDLASHGLPDDAGFVLTPAQPIAPGSKVEVRFANGRPLMGSPCQP